MKVISVCVPSSRVISPMNRALRKHGLVAKAFDAPPGPGASDCIVVEHLPCLIEPIDKRRVWITVPVHMEIADFLERSFLKEGFVVQVIDKMTDADDLMAIECVVAACTARKVLQSYIGGAKATQRLYKAVKTEGTNRARRHLAEEVLGIPSLLDLLEEYAERLIADPKHSRQARLHSA